MNHVLLTVDVEDWYQVENFKKCICVSSWSSLESRVEHNTHTLLDLLDSGFQQGVEVDRSTELCSAISPKATFFVLGWIARHMPGLVRQIHARGHEVASHGYWHNLCQECSLSKLKSDLCDSKRLLEDISGSAVQGYRAPSFSIDRRVLRMIEECGYRYDSSFNSFKLNSRYGRIDLSHNSRIGIIYRLTPGFYELPISNLELGDLVLPFGGGGYFRVAPLPLFMFGVRAILKKQNAYVFYLHPWEVDPDQPRVAEAPRFLKIRHYLHLRKNLAKFSLFLEKLKHCHFVTCSEYLEQAGCSLS